MSCFLPRRVRIALSMLMVACSFSLAGCGGGGNAAKVNEQNYGKINLGMTQAEVENLLGPGTLVEYSTTDLGQLPTSAKVFVWKDKDGEKVIKVAYDKGKVIQKTQTGM